MNFSLMELKELSFCNLINILLSQVAPEERTAKQSDIDAFLR